MQLKNRCLNGVSPLAEIIKGEGHFGSGISFPRKPRSRRFGPAELVPKNQRELLRCQYTTSGNIFSYFYQKERTSDIPDFFNLCPYHLSLTPYSLPLIPYSLCLTTYPLSLTPLNFPLTTFFHHGVDKFSS